MLLRLGMLSCRCLGSTTLDCDDTYLRYTWIVCIEFLRTLHLLKDLYLPGFCARSTELGTKRTQIIFHICLIFGIFGGEGNQLRGRHSMTCQYTLLILLAN